MQNTGWIKLYRKILESPMWQYAVKTNHHEIIVFWLWSLLYANWQDKKWYNGREEIIIKAGSYIGSYEGFAAMTGLTTQKVRTCIFHLEKMRMLTRQSTNQYTQISIINWDKYQGDDDELTNEPTNNQQTDNKRITTTKEYKNIRKKENNKAQEFQFFENEYFRQVWTDYLEMRMKIRKPATARAEELILKKLQKHRIEIATAMVEKSIENSWQGVFELKPEESEAIMRKVSIVEQGKKTETPKLTDEDVERNKTALAKMRASLADKFSLKT